MIDRKATSTSNARMPPNAVEEVQGLYGPFSVSERIIQKIWLQGDFYQSGLKTVSGKPLKILDPGAWNKNEGPDFKEARLEIDGRELCGDVELHFYPGDWFHHQHDKNPNFERVILHVVLYGGSADGWEREFPMESLELMPLLERDLEEHVMELALLDLEQVNELEWFERFIDRPLAARRTLIKELSFQRWKQKAGFAAKRLERADWRRCCHESILEVLGFARNRGTMLKIASRFTIDDFSGGLDTDQIYGLFLDDWKLSGCRPANHPKLRLQQYARICAADSDWPDQLLRYLRGAEADGPADPVEFRKVVGAKKMQSHISEHIFQGMIGKKRLNSFLCDALFPLAHCAEAGGWSSYWQHWYPGDYPDALNRFYRQSGLADRQHPMSNGQMQGILALFASRGAALDEKN